MSKRQEPQTEQVPTEDGRMQLRKRTECAGCGRTIRKTLLGYVAYEVGDGVPVRHRCEHWEDNL